MNGLELTVFYEIEKICEIEGWMGRTIRAPDQMPVTIL